MRGDLWLDLGQLAGQNNIAVGVDGGRASGKGGDNSNSCDKGVKCMFHWFKQWCQKGLDVKHDATRMVDAMFARASLAQPEAFAASRMEEEAREVRFVATLEQLAPTLLSVEAPALRRAVLEEFIERIEIGLREGGVGDMSVGKKVRAYAGRIKGNLRAQGIELK